MPRILLIDDNSWLLSALQFHFTAAGHEVVHATNGPAALRLAEEAPIDLVLLDVNIPGMDGFGICRAFKENPALRHLPIVMMTGDPAEQAQAKALAAGAIEMLPKGSMVDQLLPAVARHLEAIRRPTA